MVTSLCVPPGHHRQPTPLNSLYLYCSNCLFVVCIIDYNQDRTNWYINSPLCVLLAPTMIISISTSKK
ncbi:hypothetical protein BJV82DRAFT_612207 [Fennellomyces sp. T-0311]|nr:hypothetical protein BJV82DRAFT_612207 [Fennellomyces sp. T-0311]